MTIKTHSAYTFFPMGVSDFRNDISYFCSNLLKFSMTSETLSSRAGIFWSRGNSLVARAILCACACARPRTRHIYSHAHFTHGAHDHQQTPRAVSFDFPDLSPISRFSISDFPISKIHRFFRFLRFSRDFSDFLIFYKNFPYSYPSKNLDSRALFLYTPTGPPQSRSREPGKRRYKGRWSKIRGRESSFHAPFTF